MTTKAYAAHSPDSGFAPWELERRDPRPDDVALDILYCGVCHTDLHIAENDWGATRYPVVPGHEIIGRVTAVGERVERFAVGDVVGVGCMVDCCRSCSACEAGLENYCEQGMTPTYNGVDRHDGSITYGGYSQRVVVSERFVVRVPDGLDPAVAAPLLCAGITTFSPLRHFGVKEGTRVGVVGMGGLGHMGIKLAVAMGAEVTVFTRSDAKRAEAERNGASRVVVSSEPGALEAAARSLDLILDTVPVPHDLNPYVDCLALDGTYVLVGQLTPLEPPVQASKLIRTRRTIAGSLIGGMPETQEVLDFCAAHDVTCDTEQIAIDYLPEAIERLRRGDVRYRFVIDMSTLK